MIFEAIKLVHVKHLTTVLNDLITNQKYSTFISSLSVLKILC